MGRGDTFAAPGIRRAWIAGLPIAGPDNSGNWEWLDRSAQELHEHIGFWEMHWYVKDKELFDGDVEKLLPRNARCCSRPIRRNAERICTWGKRESSRAG